MKITKSKKEKIFPLLKELENKQLIECKKYKFDINNDIQQAKHVDSPFIRFVCWLITGKCNLKCKHCYMRTSYFYNYEPTLKDALYIIKQLYDANVLSVVITGGELFTYKYLVNILEKLIEYNIRIKGINTNASLITHDKIVALKKLTKDYLEPININISLDRLKFHDNFRGIKNLHKKILIVVKELVNYGFKVNINTCVTRSNIHELLKLYEILKELKIYSWRLDKPRDIGMWIFYRKSLEASLDQILHFYYIILEKWQNDGKPFHLSITNMYRDALCDVPDLELGEFRIKYNDNDFACGYFRHACAILSNGDVLPCQALWNLSECRIGNVFKNDLKELWGCRNMRYWKNLNIGYLKGLPQNKHCRNCPYTNYCNLGCRAEAYATYKDAFAHDPYCCFLTKYRINVLEKLGMKNHV
ncbi:MAG: radical SAM protein [Thermoprotei archaeon]